MYKVIVVSNTERVIYEGKDGYLLYKYQNKNSKKHALLLFLSLVLENATAWPSKMK